MGRLGRRDELAGQEIGRRNRIPQRKPGDHHDQRAPDHRPIFDLFAEIVAPHAWCAFGNAQIVGERLDAILGVLHRRQHGQRYALDEHLVRQHAEVIHRLGDQEYGRSTVDDAYDFDASHRHDHEFGPRLAGEFLGQAGDDQYRETRDQKRMFHALKDVKAPVFAR